MSGFVVLWRLSLRGEAGLFPFALLPSYLPTFLPFETAAEAGRIYFMRPSEALDPRTGIQTLNPCRLNLVGLVRWDQWRAEYGERVALLWQLSLA